MAMSRCIARLDAIVRSGSSNVGSTRQADWKKKPNVTSRVEAKEAPRSSSCRRSDIADGRLQKRSEKEVVVLVVVVQQQPTRNSKKQQRQRG